MRLIRLVFILILGLPLRTFVATLEPMTLGGRPVDLSARDAAARALRTRLRQPRRPHVSWKTLKHDDSTSFASSSSPEPPPTSHLS